MAKNHDMEALGDLCEFFYPQIYRFMLGRVATREDAEDLASEVCTRAVQGLPKQKGFFPAWLFRIARNLVTDFYRRQNARGSPVSTDSDRAEASITVAADTTERLLLDRELGEALARLTPEQQEIVRLRFIEGYDTTEIADIQGRSPGAVRALQFRALAALREFLAPPVRG
jgi:RNA polymerase sigma-70 factor (ECF subfamily)